ncbi:MAG: hypothetical protein M1133_13590 [Armatimonadetes bacterium]|nr:hypothetical protein [Armatimonadota bacterium]
MIDLTEVAARLDADDRLRLTYRFPVRSADGEVTFETRQGDLLDVAEEAGLLYVSHHGEVIWVKLEEVIELKSQIGG